MSDDDDVDMNLFFAHVGSVSAEMKKKDGEKLAQFNMWLQFYICTFEENFRMLPRAVRDSINADVKPFIYLAFRIPS